MILFQLFPSLIYCMIKPKVVLLIFVSGKTVDWRIWSCSAGGLWKLEVRFESDDIRVCALDLASTTSLPIHHVSISFSILFHY